MSDGPRETDMDWLYRREETPEATRVYSAEEQARLAAASRPTGNQGGYPTPPHQGYQQYQSPQGQPSQAPQRPARSPAKPPRPSKQRRPKRRRPIRRLIGVLVLAWVLFMVGTPIYAWVIGAVVDTTMSGSRPADQPGSVILLVGSDGRDTLTAEQQGELGTGDTEGSRTDSMMLLYQPPSGKSALISLPRDSWVNIPGYGNSKLNAAYSYGGAPLLIQTIEESTGIRVDGYLEVGFLGVVEAVDAVGGIEVCPESAISDQDAHLELAAGCQTIDGKTALGYVRMRKSDPSGDLGRMNRQREVIGKVAKKALNPLTLLNPISYWQLNMAAAHTLSRGSDTGMGDVFNGARVFVGSALGSGYSLTVPVADAGATRDGQSVVLWDEEASQAVFNAVITNQPDVLERYAQ